MYRYALEFLYHWKSDPARKPLIIRGVRGAGKTWLIREFARTAYPEYVYIDFENDPRMVNLFRPGADTEQLVMGLELFCGHKIDPAKTLLLFDEMQEVPGALQSLRSFCHDAPQYQIIAACSYPESFPSEEKISVGNDAEIFDLCPLSFAEFLMAIRKDRHASILENGYYNLIAQESRTYIELAKQYCIIGGMPEAVLNFAEKKDFNEVREIQKRIFHAAVDGIARRVPKIVRQRAKLISLAAAEQFRSDKKKFVYNYMKKGARAEEYEDTIRYLSACGYTYCIHRSTDPVPPLPGALETKVFRIFLFDVGIFTCMMNISPAILLNGNDIFTTHHDGIAERFLVQQLMTFRDISLAFYTNERSACSIDLLIGHAQSITPVKVLMQKNLRSKALKTYCERFHPEKSVLISLDDFSSKDGCLHVPIYAVGSGLMRSLFTPDGKGSA
jgi:predicted AAA+ superfamily ATPase